MTLRDQTRSWWLVVALLVLSARARAQGNDNAVLSARVDSIASAVLSSTGVPSATVAVVTHGQLAYAQAYGTARLEPRVAATPDMRYGIGSISKQFTAACVLLLQQEGKLSLDDPVAKYIPGLTRGTEVTIRELLSHTSGYQDFWPQDYVPPAMKKAITPQEILDHWAKQPLDFDPGTRWQYSNTNYAIAALIVEKASGKPFYQFVRTRILDPLTREIIALAVSATNGCAYCVNSHTTAVRKLGLSASALGDVMAIVALFNSTNAIAEGYQIVPDVLPPLE